MRSYFLTGIFIAAICFAVPEIKALPAKITSGQMLIGGTRHGTPDYQTYMRFDMSAQTLMPRRIYRMDAEQIYSVYLNHPPQPNGDFEYSVVIPYGPQRISINAELFAPVWYGDSIWKIQSSAQTPTVTVDSPPVVSVYAPFSMSGSSIILGAYNTGFKVSGHGTVELRFEKIEAKYYLREALYVFGTKALSDINSN